LGRLIGDWLALAAPDAPDADAELETADFSFFIQPRCKSCGNLVKPAVVFYGESSRAKALRLLRDI
jgi:NAD-dependent SIR2 family protein deacetylase